MGSGHRVRPEQRKRHWHGGLPAKPMHERFWSKVRVTARCWWWEGFCEPDGYGLVGLFSSLMITRAHRAAWLLTNGPIPAGLHVLHRCDNPPCVNPDHLFLGTHGDNMRDARLKGRLRRPAKKGQAA